MVLDMHEFLQKESARSREATGARESGLFNLDGYFLGNGLREIRVVALGGASHKPTKKCGRFLDAKAQKRRRKMICSRFAARTTFIDASWRIMVKNHSICEDGDSS